MTQVISSTPSAHSGLATLNAKYAQVGVRIEVGKAVDTAGEELVFGLKAVRVRS